MENDRSGSNVVALAAAIEDDSEGDYLSHQ
jgi:hypothetical protein